MTHAATEKRPILITGGEGMVGSQAIFGVALGRDNLNILNPVSIRGAIKRWKPATILHCAALTDMLVCEQNPDLAYETNVVGTENLAELCREYGIKLGYLSTCAVFDGTKPAPYDETDEPRPLNVYGNTKLLGERAALARLPEALVIRTGWLFGGGPAADKKFVMKMFQKMQRGEPVKATADRWGSPTYTRDLLTAVQTLIEQKAAGIYHIVNGGSATYAEVAHEIKEIGAFHTPVIPVSAIEGEPPELKRGANETLNSQKIILRPWSEALAEYIHSLRRNSWV